MSITGKLTANLNGQTEKKSLKVTSAFRVQIPFPVKPFKPRTLQSTRHYQRFTNRVTQTYQPNNANT